VKHLVLAIVIAAAGSCLAVAEPGEHQINERLTLGAELFGNSPRERGGRSDITFNLGGTWKLSEHINLLFAGGRDIVGDTKPMGYIGLQLLTK
jgi:hypothetical protein